MRRLLLGLALFIIGLHSAYATTYTVNSSMSESTIQSTVNSACGSGGNTVQFAAGNYGGWSGTLNVPAGNGCILTGPANSSQPFTGTAILNADSAIGTSGTIMSLTGCSGGSAGAGVTVEYLTFDNTAGLYLPGSCNGSEITHNEFENNNPGIGTTYNPNILFDGGGSSVSSNWDISWNNFHNNCSTINNDLTEQGGYCSATFSNGALNNGTWVDNTVNGQEEGLKMPPSAAYFSHITVQYNQFANVHRIAIEIQYAVGTSSSTTQNNVSYNYFAPPYLPCYYTFANSIPMYGSSSPGFTSNDNVIIAGAPVGCPGYGSGAHYGIGMEVWGSGITVQNNLVEGGNANATGYSAFSLGAGSGANVTNNISCGYDANQDGSINLDTSAGTPTGYTDTPNSWPLTCPVITIPTPTISPASGGFSSPPTVTLSDSRANTTIYYTTDGSTPTVNSTVYTGPFTAPASPVTINAIAQWGAGANEHVSFPSGYGYTPSNVVSATYTGSGNTWYVATSGSNSNPCTSVSPCADPVYAINTKANPGDTVSVAAGVYSYGSTQAELTTSGTSSKPITLTCATRGACTIENSVTGNNAVLWIENPYVKVNGFVITNTSSGGNNLGIYVSASNVSLTQNTIHGIETDCTSIGGGGIQLAAGVSSIVIDSNLIYDISMPAGVPKCSVSANWTDGIIAETNGSPIQITNNIVYWTSGGWGILVGPGNGGTTVSAVQVSNNLVFSNARGGIAFTEPNIYATNNILVYNGTQSGANACGYQNASGGTINYANSDLYSNAGGNYCVGYGTDGTTILTGDITVDPAGGTTFVNWQANGSGNYVEATGSPTIGSGSSSGSPPNHDYENNPRPSGAGYDMGPYQAVAGATLSSVSVAGTGNATSVPIGSTLQMLSSCVYSDGSSDACNSADAHGNQCTLYTSSNTSYGTITTGGLLTGVAGGVTDVGCTVASSSVAPTNIDDTLTGWDTCYIGSCPGGGTPGGTGTPSSTSQTINNTTPSLDGDSMKLSMTATAANTNVLWTYTGTACDSCTSVNDSYHFYPTSSTGGGTTVINYPSGFASSTGQVWLENAATLSGSSIHLATTVSHTANNAWYETPENVQAFSTTFTFHIVCPGGGTACGDGLGFMILSNPNSSTSGYTYSGFSGAQFSWSQCNPVPSTCPAISSILVKFDTYNVSTSAEDNLTGFYSGGEYPQPPNPETDMTSAGIDMQSGDEMQATLIYSGTTLTETVTDTVTAASYTTSYTGVNIPTLVGGNTGYIGFGGGTGAALQDLYLDTWTYTTGSGSTGVGNIEHDEAIFDTTHGGINAMWGRQWNQTLGLWQIFNDQAGSWVNTSCTTAPSYGAWNSIQFSGHRIIGDTSCSGAQCIYSDSLTVNGTLCSLNMKEPAGTIPGTYTHAVISQDQLDASAATTLTEYLDEDGVTFSAGTSSPQVAISVISATQVATPTFSPAPGALPSTGGTVAVADATSSSTIYCTTNGSTPTTSSPVYSTPIAVTATTTIQCIATVAGLSSSVVGSANYTLGTSGGGGGTTIPPITPNTPSQRGNIAFDQVQGADRYGNSSRFQMACSSGYVPGDLLMYDANGNACDSGSKNGSGGAGGYFAQGYSLASGGQTAITLESQPLPQSLSVYSNGAIISPANYTLSGTVVSLSTPLNAGPVVATWATTTQTPGGIGLGSSYAPVRGAASGSGSSNGPIVVSWPSGTLAGDLAVVFASWYEDGFDTIPSGWTANYNPGGGTWAPLVISKILTSADISGGSVSIPTSEPYSAPWTYQVVTFIGPTGGIRETDGSRAVNTSTSITTSGSVLPTDSALYFGGTYNTNYTAVCSVNRGTFSESSTYSTTTRSCLYTEQLVSSGATTATFSYGTGAAPEITQAIVIVENP